jgi:outer membrane protein assembly factor BamD (BamD/ComL family)
MRWTRTGSAAIAWVAVTLSAAATTRAQTTDPAPPPTAEFRDGHWQPVAPAAPPAPVADPELDHVQQLLDARDGQAALAVGLRWVKGHGKTAAQRDRCLYLIAQALYQTDDWVKAYYYLDELMDEYPSSTLFPAALEVQYHIADGFLKGHKLKVLGLPILSEEDDGIEMLFRLQQRSPGSPLAERAMLRTADYYYADGEYELAENVYDFYAKQYPRSERVPQARLRSAFAALAQFRGPRYDATPMLNARVKLTDFSAAYPALAKEENVPGILAKIDDELATALYLTADYYRRVGSTDGAVYEYRYLILTYPKAAEVPAARAALARMPAWALAQPVPRAGRPYVTPAVPPRQLPAP